jgi:hypothetical protein
MLLHSYLEVRIEGKKGGHLPLTFLTKKLGAQRAPYIRSAFANPESLAES